MSIAAMRQALEVLELEDLACRYEKEPTPEHIADAITALRTAIEQAEKPVAWRWKALVNGEFVSNWVLTHSEPPPYATESMPLYTAPRQWVGLTDEEVNEFYWISASTLEAIEAKLKEKNGG
jgi:hypothetical protein